ncbi:hypothetical protein OIU85_015963 [Salix viminalis]|uniref:Uncharacterized protein n=1 Tax=Salix viminalis TaxID=40686 RepID=A0A9Q0V472_SALVM|nr:hypothetical protein OIU85_015963 [Salix viminalis]
MAESVPSMADSSSAASVQIVYTKRPQDEESEAYHIRTLASVLGSYCTVWCRNLSSSLQIQKRENIGFRCDPN